MANSTSGQDLYKYQWARYIAREKLESDFQILNNKLAEAGMGRADSLSALANDQFQDKFTGRKPAVPGKFKVGIVGAGCSGLFTAMIIDFLNQKVKDLNIEYDILEAGTPERLGGRLYTHHFSEGKHDYYDVGAMRFPDNKIMKRYIICVQT
jgi:hypothetical protein